MQAGIVLRERYSPFLGRDVDEVSAVSSSANRCIQSARLVLTAAYPQSIVPITVSVPEHDILGADTSCAAWQEATELQFLDPHVEIFFRNEEPFLNNVSQWSGQSFNYMADPQKLYETLSIEQENNKTIPEWADASVMTQLREVDEKIFCINTSSPLIRTLEVGRLLKDLGTRFLRGTGSQKLFLYSTHDRVLLSLMKQLFPSDVTAVPGYGATLIMEMFRSAGSNDTTLHTYFLPDPNTPKLQPLQFKGCELTCPLTPVTALVDAAALTQSQHETVCNMPINVSTPTDCF